MITQHLPMISIEIPVTWGNYLTELMEALRTQTSQDFEIIMALEKGNEGILELVKDYDVKYTFAGSNILTKRYFAHKFSVGDRSLLLDETRIPDRTLIEKLALISEEMAIISEIDYGNSILNRLANIDRLAALQLATRNVNTVLKGYVMPRFFASDLLGEALEEVKIKLGNDAFERVLMEDHQLITIESYKKSKSIAFIQEILIHHYSESSFVQILKKYYNYGKCHKYLVNTAYDSNTGILERVRSLNASNFVPIVLHELIRGIPFVMGYYLSGLSSGQHLSRQI